jgi:hypothetical protein
MVLFHHMIEVSHLTDGDGDAVLLVVPPGRGRVDLTPSEGDLLGDAMATNCPGEIALGGLQIPLLRQKNVNDLAGLYPWRAPGSAIAL